MSRIHSPSDVLTHGKWFRIETLWDHWDLRKYEKLLAAWGNPHLTNPITWDTSLENDL
jgi:hypothetical protein